MATEKTESGVPASVDSAESPFELQAIEGLPFDGDSEEATAIRDVIAEAERERAAQSSSSP